MVPALSAELIHDILSLAVPSWKWGRRWKEKRQLKVNHAHIFWFLNLRLVNSALVSNNSPCAWRARRKSEESVEVEVIYNALIPFSRNVQRGRA
jgi:hypothetical protein